MKYLIVSYGKENEIIVQTKDDSFLWNKEEAEERVKSILSKNDALHSIAKKIDAMGEKDDRVLIFVGTEERESLNFLSPYVDIGRINGKDWCLTQIEDLVCPGGEFWGKNEAEDKIKEIESYDCYEIVLGKAVNYKIQVEIKE